MKTIDEGIAESDGYTGKLSDVARQLAFAGIALIWLVKAPDKPVPGLAWDEFLLWPLGALVVGLALDLSQYLFLAQYWHRWYRSAETTNDRLIKQGGTAQTTFKVSAGTVGFGYVLFYMKVIAIWCAYCLIIGWMCYRLVYF